MCRLPTNSNLGFVPHLEKKGKWPFDYSEAIGPYNLGVWIELQSVDNVNTDLRRFDAGRKECFIKWMI